MNKEILNQITAQIKKLDEKKTLTLPESGSWAASVHEFDEDSIYVLKAALAARRPLLLRGDPGTGKSQLARAAAQALGRLFVYDVVNAHTESKELLWKFDAVGRLAEAQTLKADTDKKVRQNVLNSKRYISPGVLWWALCWKSAMAVYEESQYQLTRPEKPHNWQQTDGSVVLIDEIDKANAELPNGLLEILANNSVDIPWLKTTIGGKEALPPLIIITTNEERELPPAFVRRCLVLHMDLPKEDDALITLLEKRGKLHFEGLCNSAIRLKAAQQLVTDRRIAREKAVTLPGQAEYLDMLRALSVLGKSEAAQSKMLDNISKFMLRKHAVMHD